MPSTELRHVNSDPPKKTGDCAPSFRSPPDASRAPFPHRSPRRSSANAACGGLKPPTAGRLRRAKPSSPAQHHIKKLYLHRTPLCARGTRSFSNLVSRRDLLTCDDASCLTRCHRAFVSNSCHFFSERRYPSLWRHMQSVRDADNPFGRFRHVAGFPEELTRSRALVGDERPSSTVRLASFTGNPQYSISPYSVMSGRCHGSRIAKRMAPDRLGSVPGVALMSSLCGDAVPFAAVWPR